MTSHPGAHRVQEFLLTQGDTVLADYLFHKNPLDEITNYYVETDLLVIPWEDMSNSSVLISVWWL